MKRIVLATLIALLLGAGISGCNSAWWQNFKNDPAQQVQSFEQTVQVVVADAQIAWTVVQPFLPPAQAPAITQQYTNAVVAVNHALQVLNDAVKAAADAQQSTPDFAGLMQAVSDAVAQVIAIVDQYKGSSPPAPAVADGGAPMLGAKAPVGDPPGLADAKAGSATLKKYLAH